MDSAKSPKNIKCVGKYELHKTLGEGAFGKVKLAVTKESREMVAIKILNKDYIHKNNMGAQIKKEISIMKIVHHVNVVEVKDVFATQSKIFIVLELVQGGELFDKAVKKGRLPEEKIKYYFRQLLDGLEYCHTAGVCHRDLKPENLLLDQDDQLKINDFGLAGLYVGDAAAHGYSRSELLASAISPPTCIAPEVLSDKPYDTAKADVWSCGVILYCMLAGHLPFQSTVREDLFTQIKSGLYPPLPSDVSSSACDLLAAMLTVDAHARVSLAGVLRNVWLESTASAVTPLAPPSPAAASNRVPFAFDVTSSADHARTDTLPPSPSASAYTDVSSFQHGPSQSQPSPPDNQSIPAGVSVTDSYSAAQLLAMQQAHIAQQLQQLQLQDELLQQHQQRQQHQHQEAQEQQQHKEAAQDFKQSEQGGSNDNSADNGNKHSHIASDEPPAHSAAVTADVKDSLRLNLTQLPQTNGNNTILNSREADRQEDSVSQRRPSQPLLVNHNPLSQPSTPRKTLSIGNDNFFECLCNPFASFVTSGSGKDNGTDLDWSYQDEDAGHHRSVTALPAASAAAADSRPRVSSRAGANSSSRPYPY